MTAEHVAGATKRWSLRRRIDAWVVVGVLTLGVGSSVFVRLLFDASLRRELDALAVEEIAELEVLALEAPLDVARVREVARLLDAAHPEAQFGVRVWREGEGAPWALAGLPREDPAATPRPGREEVTERLDRRRRVRTGRVAATLREPDGGELPEELVVELLVDGSSRAADLERATVAFVTVAAIAGLAALGGGLLFSRRLAGMLQEVARSAGETRLDVETQPAAPASAPDEVLHVVEAFRGSIAGMRDQHRRNVMLTAGLAHELRSPLQNLLSEVEVARLRPRTGDSYGQFVAGLDDELRALALVVDNLVTLTALRDEGFRGRPEEVDFADELGMRLTYEEREAARRGVTLDVRSSGDCRLWGDREALVLMARNLVGNAVRWTGSGSTVTLTVSGDADAVTLTVDDQGPGVPVPAREAIFEPFHRGPSPPGVRGGYGLGLALARAAARRQGGDIEVGDAPGAGASFRVRLARGAAPG